MLTDKKLRDSINCEKSFIESIHGSRREPDEEQIMRSWDGRRAEQLFFYELGISNQEVIDLSKLSTRDKLKVTREAIKSAASSGKAVRQPAFKACDINGRPLIAIPDLVVPDIDNDENLALVEVTSFGNVVRKDTGKLSKTVQRALAYHKHVTEQLEYRVRSYHVVGIDSEYVRSGEIEKSIFSDRDLTDQVRYSGLERKIIRANDLIDRDNLETKLCWRPNKCMECKKNLPEYNVFQLIRGRKIAWEFLKNEQIDLHSITDLGKLNDDQFTQVSATRSGNPIWNRGELDEFLKTLFFPYAHLDFETFATRIPLLDGVKYCQQVPFQYSIHLENSSGKLEHREYFADPTVYADPRRAIAEKLIKDLKGTGSIISYNWAFEKGIIQSLAERFTDIAPQLESLIDRGLDLWEPFRKMMYYHPEQKGSTSLKYVAPVLGGQGYTNLEIPHGMAAMLFYLRLRRGEISNPELGIRHARAYCCQDTYNQVLILRNLKKLAA